MRTKNTLIAGIVATTLLFSANTFAEDVIEDTLDVAPAAAGESSEFVFTEAPTVTDATDTTVTLTWNALKDSIGYLISYGETSVQESNGEIEFYDMETEDLIETNEYTVKDLKPNTTYYMVVTAIDENGNETPFSPEAKVTTTEAGSVATPVMTEGDAIQEPVAQEQAEEVAPLMISSLEATLVNQIKVTFNKTLENTEGAVREFSVVNKSTSEEVTVENTSLENGNTVVLDLAAELNTDSEYDLTVIALKAEDGSNIEAGVEGVRSFTTPVTLNTAVVPEVEVVDTPAVEEPEVDLNAAPEKATKLPQTGAEEVIVLMLALMLSGLVFMRRKA